MDVGVGLAYASEQFGDQAFRPCGDTVTVITRQRRTLPILEGWQNRFRDAWEIKGARPKMLNKALPRLGTVPNQVGEFVWC